MPFLVDRAMMATTEQHQVAERGGTALGPVLDVMAFTQAGAAPREAAKRVAGQEGAPEGGRDGASAGPDLHCAAVAVVPHHHPAGIAGEALCRSRGNAARASQLGSGRCARPSL